MPKRVSVYGLLWLCAWVSMAFAEVDPPASQEQASPGLLPVCVTVFEHQCGLLDRSGHWAAEPRYGELYASDDDWIATTRAGRVGLLDTQGRQLIAPRFQTIGRFRNGMAPATLWSDDHYGYIDTQGRWVLAPRFDLAGQFVDGIAATATQAAGQMRYAYIDPQAKQVVPGSYEGADSFLFGLAEISRGENDTREIALIDLHGNIVVPWGSRYSLQPLMPNRVLDTSDDALMLRDGQGRVLFQAKGGSEPAEGRLFYTPDGQSLGLLDIESGKPLVAPRKDWREWYAGVTFSDGLAWICAAESCDDHVLTLIDRQGRVVLPAAKYEDARPFVAGVAPVKYPGKSWQLIDKHGHAVTAPLYDGMLQSAWESSPQTARSGDVWLITSDDAKSGGRDQHWIDAHGRTLASVEGVACGIEVVRNGAGEIIWPRDVDASCAVKRKELGASDPADATVSAERIAAVEHAKAQDVVDGQVDVMQRETGRNVLPMLAGPPADLWNDSNWQHGSATVHLDGAASLTLPVGYRYLPPKAVHSMHDRLAAAGLLDAAGADADKVPLALLAPDDATWIMSVVLMPQGHIDTDHVDFDVEQLRQTMEVHSTNILGQLSNPTPTLHNISWIRQPKWDASAHRLDWSYEDFTLGGSSGTTIYLTAVTLGRRATVGMQIALGGADAKDRALIAQDAFDKLIKGVAFDAGETYADVQPGDPRAALGLGGYVVGPPTKEEQELPKKLEESRLRDFWHTVVERIVPVLGVALVGLGARRKLKK